MATFKNAREFYNAVIAANISADLTEYAQKLIDALDHKNAQRKVSKSALAHQAANADLKGAIVQALTDGQKTAADLATALGVSTQKVSALARQLVEDGTITVDDVKVKGKGKVKGYALPTDDEDSEDNAD